jgi:ketosteroid isomerase-like protein
MNRTIRRSLLLATLATPLLLSLPSANAAADTDAMLSNYIKALNANMPPRNNAEAVANLFTPEATQYHPLGEPTGAPQRGREVIKKFFAGFDQMLKSWEHVESTRTVQGQRAVWEGFAQGVHRESGKFVKLPIVFFLEFNDQGLVKEDRVYINPAMLQEQIKQ